MAPIVSQKRGNMNMYRRILGRSTASSTSNVPPPPPMTTSKKLIIGLTIAYGIGTCSYIAMGIVQNRKDIAELRLKEINKEIETGAM